MLQPEGASLSGELFWHTRFWMLAVGLFVFGWIFQFIGHAFESKPSVFFQDWHFLYVGLR